MTAVSANFRIDYTLFGIVALLVVAGFSAVLSASSEYAQFHLYMAIKQGFFYLVAFWAFVVVSLVPLYVWERFGWVLLFIGIALLLAVLVPGIGQKVNGASRWISFGVMSLQVSELVKLCVVLYMEF